MSLHKLELYLILDSTLSNKMIFCIDVIAPIMKYWIKNFIIINAGSLTISLDNQPCFVSLDFSFNILLCLELPLHSNGFLLFWNSRQLPCVVLFNCFDFLIHGISQFFIFHHFFKTYWFTIRKMTIES
jgi:hypothetical protein